jgi:hypothetical protein
MVPGRRRRGRQRGRGRPLRGGWLRFAHGLLDGTQREARASSGSRPPASRGTPSCHRTNRFGSRRGLAFLSLQVCSGAPLINVVLARWVRCKFKRFLGAESVRRCTRWVRRATGKKRPWRPSGHSHANRQPQRCCRKRDHSACNAAIWLDRVPEALVRRRSTKPDQRTSRRPSSQSRYELLKPAARAMLPLGTRPMQAEAHRTGFGPAISHPENWCVPLSR